MPPRNANSFTAELEIFPKEFCFLYDVCRVGLHTELAVIPSSEKH